MTTKKNEGPLTLAALALEDELLTFEELVNDLARLHVNSDKTLQRARQNLEACSEFEQKLAERLKAFAEAMQQMQMKQQGCMTAALEHAHRIQARNDARNVLLERVNALGLSARDINAPMNDLVIDDAGKSDPTQVLAKIQHVGERLEAVIAEAAAVANAAKEGDWQDIARDADVLKQQLQSARNKVLVAQRNVAERAPS
jgi:hypothetical protein